MGSLSRPGNSEAVAKTFLLHSGIIILYAVSSVWTTGK